jgi:bifunctional DNA-binding transcriptional regulator/antitoxin component of YhaV-PrlF toxin-antitoxin module
MQSSLERTFRYKEILKKNFLDYWQFCDNIAKKKEVGMMEATIDRFGRILIPYKLRKILGLQPGVVLEIQGSEDEIRLKPVEGKAPLFKKDGVLVFSADSTGDITDVLEKVRTERTRTLITPHRK